MPVSIRSTDDGTALEVVLTGRLHHEDYEQFVPVLERKLDEGHKLRVLARLVDFHGWDAGALWDDIKFDARHARDIEKLALVGDRSWERGMATFCRPFTTADVRFFDSSDLEAARRWIAE